MDNLHRLLGTLLGYGPFLLKALVGGLLFSTHFQRHLHFLLRISMGFGVELLLGSLVFRLCYFSDSWPIQNTLYYLLLFLLSFISLFIAFDEQPTTLILCAVSGYMTEHISAQILQMAQWWDTKIWRIKGVPTKEALCLFVVQLVLFVFVAVMVYLLFACRTTYVV